MGNARKSYRDFSVGLTGGIGSGKTFVADIFAEHGAFLIDADVISRELTAKDGAAIDVIGREFGARYVEGGILNRDLMREHVFDKPEARLKLESILHPMIRDEAFARAEKVTGTYVIFVNPLLLDLPVFKGMGTRVLVVDCPEELQVERVVKRSALTPEAVRKIMTTQMGRIERLKRADDVIVNAPGGGDLAERIKKLHLRYEAESLLG